MGFLRINRVIQKPFTRYPFLRNHIPVEKTFPGDRVSRDIRNPMIRQSAAQPMDEKK